jgi:uncharacterized lipoprotein YajG
MNARITPLTLFAVLVTLGGCTSLDIGYPETVANRARLASVTPRHVVVGPITDRRIDQTRIGAKPQNGDGIKTRRPVVEIVREAFVVELTKNGHVVVPAEGDIRVAADVEEFWLDAAGHDGATQYVGRVALALVVTDGRGGTTLLTRRYVGTKRVQAEADSKDAWRDAMNMALARVMRDIATDPDLVAALARRPPSARHSADAIRRRSLVEQGAVEPLVLIRGLETTMREVSPSRAHG